MSISRFGVKECWRPKFHRETYGVLMLRSTPMIVHGPPVTGSQLMVLLPGNTVPNQSRVDPGKKATAVAMFPPELLPLESICAPVGTVASPRELFKARNDSQLTVSYISPAPARRTVRPLPRTSHAKPARGAKLLRSGL